MSESEYHQQQKLRWAAKLSSEGYPLVFIEEKRADAVGVKGKPPLPPTLAIEVQVSERLNQTVKNLTRDFANGCDMVVIIAPSFYRCWVIERQLPRYFPPEMLRRVVVTTPEEFENRPFRELLNIKRKV